MKCNKSLVEMEHGKMGVIVDICGGRALSQRLDAMCITPGAQLRKISGSFMGGPVTVQVGSARLALGFGIASRIILEVEAQGPR